MYDTENQAIDQISLEVDLLVEKFNNQSTKRFSPMMGNSMLQSESQLDVSHFQKIIDRKLSQAQQRTLQLQRDLTIKDQQINQLIAQKRSLEAQNMELSGQIENHKTKISNLEHDLSLQNNSLKQLQKQFAQLQEEKINQKYAATAGIQEQCKKYGNFIIGKVQESQELFQIFNGRFEYVDNFMQLIEDKDFPQFSLKALKLICDLFVYIANIRQTNRNCGVTQSRFSPFNSPRSFNNLHCNNFYPNSTNFQQNMEFQTQNKQLMESSNKKFFKKEDSSFQNYSSQMSQDYQQNQDNKTDQESPAKIKELGTPQFLDEGQKQHQRQISIASIKEENQERVQQSFLTKQSSLEIKQQQIQKYLDHKKQESEKASKILNQIKLQNELLKNMNQSSQSTPQNQYNNEKIISFRNSEIQTSPQKNGDNQQKQFEISDSPIKIGTPPELKKDSKQKGNLTDRGRKDSIATQRKSPTFQQRKSIRNLFSVNENEVKKNPFMDKKVAPDLRKEPVWQDVGEFFGGNK